MSDSWKKGKLKFINKITVNLYYYIKKIISWT
jgi:hypothetical protein